MRTTVNIDDNLLRRLKLEAERCGLSLGESLNRALEKGLDLLAPEALKAPYHTPTFSMGAPAFELDKALSYAATLEDEETLRKLHLRK